MLNYHIHMDGAGKASVVAADGVGVGAFRAVGFYPGHDFLGAHAGDAISIHAPRGGSDSKDAQISGCIFGKGI